MRTAPVDVITQNLIETGTDDKEEESETTREVTVSDSNNALSHSLF